VTRLDPHKTVSGVSVDDWRWCKVGRGIRQRWPRVYRLLERAISDFIAADDQPADNSRR
jgi:hypothetical protein